MRYLPSTRLNPISSDSRTASPASRVASHLDCLPGGDHDEASTPPPAFQERSASKGDRERRPLRGSARSGDRARGTGVPAATNPPGEAHPDEVKALLIETNFQFDT